MVAYADTTSCRMLFLRRELDDDDDETPCGRCDNCGGPAPRRDAPLDPAVVAEAVQFLRAAQHVLEPRKQWPNGLSSPKGRIPAETMNEEGRILSVYGDGGWGNVVRQARSQNLQYPASLVEASHGAIKAWMPDPSPTWVTCVPTRDGGRTLARFAQSLAERLGLPFIEALRRTREGAPQREMENSVQQMRNVHGAFAVADAPPGPVLLVDDTVDSRWTLTVVGAELREAGAPAVFPFVLAKAMGS